MATHCLEFLKVDLLIQKEREKQEKLQQKHTVTVEAYEKKMSSKEIDSRVAPYQQKLSVLKQEVADLLHLLDD
jgi:oligosaccharyltransferase complex subunit alpha (ribophorin I)